MSAYWFDKDEWYPVYSIHDEAAHYRYPLASTVTAKQVERWRKAEAEFIKAQDEIAALAVEQRDAR